MKIKYPEITDCTSWVFPYIKEVLAVAHNPYHDYENDAEGMKELKKYLQFVKNRRYYPRFHKKAAYLFCTIIKGHPFDNGNKRLAVSMLLLFLIDNKASVRVDIGFFKSLVADAFPKHQWETKRIGGPTAMLLYNLSVALADSDDRYPETSEKVTHILKSVFLR